MREGRSRVRTPSPRTFCLHPSAGYPHEVMSLVILIYHEITLDWELIGFAGHVDLSIRACLVSLVFLAVYAAFDLPSVLRADRDFLSSLVVVFEQSPTPAKTIECLSPAYRMPSFMIELSRGTVSFKIKSPSYFARTLAYGYRGEGRVRHISDVYYFWQRH
ncbi:uncharacterized protein ASPGLDRAFT_33841 [Aspergillus glaucus CBS 516.65]|uniref:Uncharacterized protein n=1 Tax=Aspergillus glaucus CBS 516.65 TaxID=1160497 RepID=A0A1L9VPS0_ASPGL|nr:hypothetical protein ASPGLDRAFT_33841 [Aspergillus glaucus CBS 516.65]OJJ85917.1 hypothetical protein ASPGLDRAFT_33841 [Aspergillus glaucus CBS 516.65]